MIFQHISRNMTHVDYFRVRDLTNFIAETTGKSPVYINTEMYVAGSQDNPLDPVPELKVIELLSSISGKHTRSDHFLDYFARSFNPNYDHWEYYRTLKERIQVADVANLHINAQEVQILKAKINFFSEDVEAYDRALKPNPTAEDAAWLALRKPCWSISFPIKAYLLDHPEIGRNYRGLQPIGKFVVRYYNAFVDYINQDVAGTEELRSKIGNGMEQGAEGVV